MHLFRILVLSLRDPHGKKGTQMLKNNHVAFVDINRAQTEQQLNFVHDRDFGSSPHRGTKNPKHKTAQCISGFQEPTLLIRMTKPKLLVFRIQFPRNRECQTALGLGPAKAETEFLVAPLLVQVPTLLVTNAVMSFVRPSVGLSVKPPPLA